MNKRLTLRQPNLKWQALLAPLPLVIALAVIVAGVLAGGWVVAANHSNEWASRSNSLQRELADAKVDLKKVTADRDDYQSQAETASAERDDIDTRQQNLDEAEAKLAEQQKQFEAEQKRVEASQISDGVHLVGTDTAPGVYSLRDSTDCYYVWKTGTGSDASIVDNNIVSGPATVTLKAGEVFETNGCGTWTKVG